MTNTAPKDQKMHTKDVVTVVLLALVNIVLFGLSTFLYLTPFTILLMPVYFSLLEGIAFFFIGAKVKKKGAILLYAVVRGVLGVYPPYVLLYILGGLIGEVLMARFGYGNTKGLTLSYVILQVLACIGSTIYPYTIAFDSMMAQGGADMRSDNVIQAAAVLQSYGWIVLPITVLPASASLNSPQV